MIGGIDNNHAHSPLAPAPSKSGVLVRNVIALALIALAQLAPTPATASTPAEEWAQAQVCAGQVADFSARSGVVLDPRQPEQWDERRQLGAAFLAKLVNGDSCRIPPHGVDIVGAWFPEAIDLQGANIAMQLRVRGSRFEAPVQLDRVRAEKLLSFAGSRFGSPLLMTEIGVRGSLFLGEGATFEDKVVLWGASIDGQASFSSESLDVEVVAPARPAGKDAAAGEPRVTRFDGDLDMTSLRVGRILDLRGIRAAKNITLDRARVDDDLRLSGAHFIGNVSMDSIKVGESVEAWGVAWGEQQSDGSCVAQANPATARWQFYYADVGANIYLSGACLADLAVLNLSGSRIGGQLFLGSIDHYPANVWGPQSIMILRNTSVGKIQDLPSIQTTGPAKEGKAAPTPAAGAQPGESWPLRLELDGFTYTTWDGLGRQERPTDDTRRRVVPPRDDHWLISWLSRDHSYSRQPYEQLAKVMAAQGRTESRDDILFTSHEIERCIAVNGLTSEGIEDCILQRSGIAAPPAEQTASPRITSAADQRAPDAGAGNKASATQLWDYTVLTATWLLNGYGYRPRRALGWFVVLILIGTLLFRYRTDEGRSHSIWFAAEYAFDTLLPAVTLNKDFDRINIDSLYAITLSS